MSDTETAVAELEFAALSWPVRAERVLVTNETQFETVGMLLTGIKALREEIAETCDPVIEAARTVHQTALAQKRTLEAPLVQAEATIKRKLAAYHDERERARRAEQARLQAEQAEAARQAREAEREHLAKAGETQAVAELDAEPELPLAPPVLPPAAKAEGVSMRETWRGEVVDVKAFCRGVAEGVIPVSAVTPNMASVNGAARAMREALNWPGTRAIRETTVAARAAR